MAPRFVPGPQPPQETPESQCLMLAELGLPRAHAGPGAAQGTPAGGPVTLRPLPREQEHSELSGLDDTFPFRGASGPAGGQRTQAPAF